MAKKSSTYKRTKKAPKWQLPLLLILVLVAVGFGVFIVFFSRANTNSPQVYLTTNNASNASAATNIGGSGGFTYGEPGDKIIACNWDGVNYGTTNVATIGAYRPSTSQFFLNNNNGSNAASLSFTFGNPNDVPLCGRWYSNPDDKATVGVFRNGTFYLASSNTNGGGTVKDVSIGANGGDVPLACDWNGDGRTDIGYYRPSEGKFYLYLWYGSWSKVKEFQYGPASNLTRYPICGNWDGATNNGGTFDYDTVGFYDTTNGTFYLRNTNSASADIAAGATVTKFADPNTLKLAPVTGRFTASPTTYIGGYTITEKPAPAPTTTSTGTTTGTTATPQQPDPCPTNVDYSTNIRQLQICVKSKGASIAVDNNLGPQTRDACIKYPPPGGCPSRIVNYGVSSGSIGGTGFMPGAGGGSLTATQIVCQAITKDINTSINTYKTQRSLFDTQWPESATYSAWRKTERARFVNGINSLAGNLISLSGCTQSAAVIQYVFTGSSSTRDTLDSIANTMRAIIYPNSRVY